MTDGRADRRTEARADAPSDQIRERARGGVRRSARLCEVSVGIEVPFHDVDPLGIVWHGHYYKYFELARTALLRSCALDAADLRALGFAFLLVESRCRHVTPLRYGDRASVSAWLRDLSHRLDIEYEIRRADRDTVVARGQTALATVNRQGRLLMRTPAAIRARLEAPRPPTRDGATGP